MELFICLLGTAMCQGSKSFIYPQHILNVYSLQEISPRCSNASGYIAAASFHYRVPGLDTLRGDLWCWCDVIVMTMGWDYLFDGAL